MKLNRRHSGRSFRKIILFILFLLVIFLVGCAEPRNLEDLGLQTALGYDVKEDGTILGTAVLHHFKTIGEKPVQVLTATANTSKGFRHEMNLKTSKKLVSGQIRLAVIGEETAKKGIIPLIDSLSRDPKIGTMLYLAVAEGTANEILSYQYKDIANIGIYIQQTITQNIEGEQLISTTLHEINNAYYAQGQDPALVYIKREKENINIEGIALFRGERMVGILKAEETFYLKLIKDRFDAGELEMILPTKDLKKYLTGKMKAETIKIDIDSIASSSKIKLVNRDKPEFDIKIKFTTRIQETSLEIDLGKPEVIKTLGNLLNDALEKEANLVIKKMQKLQSDPIGFGRIYNHSSRQEELTNEEWHRIYEDAQFNVHVETSILNTGVID